MLCVDHDISFLPRCFATMACCFGEELIRNAFHITTFYFNRAIAFYGDEFTTERFYLALWSRGEYLLLLQWRPGAWQWQRQASLLHPAPNITTLEGLIVPAAVVIIGNIFPDCAAASNTALYPARLACELVHPFFAHGKYAEQHPWKKH